MDTKNTKAIIYCRVSTKEQEQGFSLDAQQHLIESYAQNNNLHVVEIVRVSESASKGFLRKMFFKTFDYCRENDVHHILVEKIDRFTRNLKDAGYADDWIREDYQNEIHFVKENFIASQKSKAHENLVWNMKVAIARFYTQNLSEEVIKGNQEKVSQGFYHGSYKIGYICSGATGQKYFEQDEKTAPIVKKLLEDYATGQFTMSRLRKSAHDFGLRSRYGKPLYKSQIEKLLKDPFYYGYFDYKGALYKGNHVPLISKETFDQITQVRTKGRAPAMIKHVHVFEKSVYCGECGALFSSETQKGNVYCYCKNHKNNCSQGGGLRADHIEQEILKAFDMFSNIPQVDADEILQKIKENHQVESEYKKTVLNNLNANYLTIQHKIDRMYDDKISGIITNDFWRKKYDELIVEQNQIQDQIGKLKGQEANYFELYINILDLAHRAKDIFTHPNRTNAEKRQIISLMFESIEIKDRVVEYRLKEPVRNYQKTLSTYKKFFEPNKSLKNSHSFQFFDKTELVLRTLDEFRIAIIQELQHS